MHSNNTRDRLIALEVQVHHLAEAHQDTHAKVTELHNLLLQARGARWMILAAATATGFATSWLPKLASWIVLLK